MNEIRSTHSIAAQAVEAVQAGRDINANPYPVDSDAHRHWRRVFFQARQELGELSAVPMVKPARATRFEAAQA